MKRILYAGVWIFILIVTFIFYFSLYYPRQAYVVEIIDGDTVKIINGKYLRYLGINTPETKLHKDNSWQRTGSYWGNKARSLNVQMVLGRKVRIEYDKKKKDKYNRLLGYVFVNGEMINTYLLKKGLAIIDIRYPNYKYVHQFTDAFREAVRKKSGMWRNPYRFDRVDMKNYVGEIGVFEGEVLEVVEDKNRILILFPGDFQAVIFKDNLGLFKNRDLNLKGNRVRVYGMLKKYKGSYEIVVHHPLQLEVVK